MEVAATLTEVEALRSAVSAAWESGIELEDRRDELRSVHDRFVDVLGEETVNSIMKELAATYNNTK